LRVRLGDNTTEPLPAMAEKDPSEFLFYGYLHMDYKKKTK
jgi:hypothetical protein